MPNLSKPGWINKEKHLGGQQFYSGTSPVRPMQYLCSALLLGYGFFNKRLKKIDK